jgi:hypothetical protein
MTRVRMPMVECPHCEREFQVDDYCDFISGHIFPCPNCEKTIYICATDLVWGADIGTTEPSGG